MTTATLLSPFKVALPRATRYVLGSLNQFMGSLEHTRQALDQRHEQAQRARDAAAVREYAQRCSKQDPRLASDLYAAADRHESQQ
jgi:hypothetical protein